MGLAETTPSMLAADELAASIARGEVVLPDFQRDFDWTEKDVRALLATVLQGWPAGSLLLMRGQPTFFHIRPFEDAPEKQSTVKLVVLDGQQRLTSVFRALFDKGPCVYAFDSRVFDGSDIDNLEDSIVGIKRDTWDAEHRDPANYAKSGLIPLYALKSAVEFMAWREAVVKAASANADVLAEKLKNLYGSTLSQVNAYQFPAVLMERTLEPAAIARIFERVNKTGLRLGAFDLMVARVYDPKWNLRDHWSIEYEVRPRLPYFLEDDGTPILQTISLRESLNVRQSAVLDLTPAVVRKHWDKAAKAVDGALAFLTRECGVVEPAWIPYKAMILPVAALIMDSLDLKANKNTLIRWFWDRAFNQAYEVASNTRLVSDYRLLKESLTKGTALQTSAPKETGLLQATRRANGALHRAFMCCLAARDATDPLQGDLGFTKARAERSGLPPEVATHSLFREAIKTEAIPPEFGMRVLGTVFLGTSTVGTMRGKSLYNALRDLNGSAKKSALSALGSQFIPSIEDLSLASKDPASLIRKRLERLSTFLEKVTGQRVE